MLLAESKPVLPDGSGEEEVIAVERMRGLLDLRSRQAAALGENVPTLQQQSMLAR